MTERQIQLVLFREFGQRAQIAMPNYTPFAWYESDVALITRAGYLHEYEAKLTLSDFRADARKMGKHKRLAQGYERGPVKFWYVTPSGLLAGETLPPWAGLIELAVRPTYALPVIASVKDGPRLHNTKVADRVVDHMRYVAYFRYWNAIGCLDRMIRDRQWTAPEAVAGPLIGTRAGD